MCGPSYTSQSPNVDAQRCVNFYPESDESGWGKSAVALYGTPGSAIFASLAGGVSRGTIRIPGNPERVFFVIGPNFWELFSNGSSTLRNPSNQFPGMGMVSMCASPQQILILAAGESFCYNLDTNAFEALQTYTMGSGGVSTPVSIAAGGINYHVGDVVAPAGAAGTGATFSVSSVTPAAGGVIQSAGSSIAAGGSGYAVGNTISPVGAGSGASFSVTSVSPATTGQLIAPITIANGGSGYRVGNTITVSGGTSGTMTVTGATSISGGAIVGIIIQNAGSGYSVGSTITLIGASGTGASFKVASISGGGLTGPVTSLTILSGGSGYVVSGTNYNTNVTSPPVGSGLVLQIGIATAIVGGVVNGLNLATAGTGYTTASGVSTTGGSGTGLKLNITATAGVAGAVTGLVLLAGGSGYSSGSGVATTGGTGTGLTLNITATAITTGQVTAVAIVTGGTGYSPAANQPMSGGSGTGLQLNYSTNGISPGSGMISNPLYCVYIDGFFIVLQANSQQIQVSQPLDASTWDPTQISIVSVFPDNVVGMAEGYRQLWLQGSNHTQIYFDSGNTFPFDIVEGGFIEQGLVAALSVVRLDNSMFWLGRDERGSMVAWRANGYTPQRVSNHAVEYIWQGYQTVSDAIGIPWQYSGHSFWTILFPTANATWTYDAATGSWHENTWFNSSTGQFGAYFANCHVYAFGMHLFGSWANGNVYQVGEGFYDDAGDPIQRVRVSPYIFREHEWIRHNKIELDFEVGLGPQPPLTDGDGNPRQPQVMLDWSDDQAKTWSNGRVLDCGYAGDYTKRVFARMLGRSRGRVYRIRCTDPIPWRVADAYLLASPNFTTQERISAQYGKMG